MEAVIALLTDTLLTVSDAPPEMVVQVKEIEREMALAVRTDEVAARTRLAGCLMELRAESLAEPRKSRAAPPLQTGRDDIDDIISLPDARSATQSVCSNWKRRGEYYVAVLAFERLEIINLRFGFPAGVQMLLMLPGKSCGFLFSVAFERKLYQAVNEFAKRNA